VTTAPDRPLTVLSVAYPFAPLGPATAGGAEQILSALDAALVDAGHRSIVVAAAGSRCRGELVPVPRPRGVLDDPARTAIVRHVRAAIGRGLAQPVDVVHLHGVDFLHYLPPPGVPVVATLHLPPSFYPAEALRPARPRTHLVCVSPRQRAACPAGAVGWTIPNGVPVDAFPAARAKGQYVVALGRICPEKGYHLAADAAARAGRRLILAGTVFPYAAHRAYFERELRPRLGPGCRFAGPVGGARKAALLAGARCLLVPSLVPETSCLVAMEALAAGTPVVAFPAGALADLVEAGRTGFLVRDATEMADAIEAAGALDPAECRRVARRRHSALAMAARYLALYRALAAGRPAPAVSLAS
jgi:glycosyltransferase involved in cell wall biosynthesis